MFTGLHHIGVMTADIDRSMAYYQNLGLTLREAFDMPGGTRIAFLRAGSAVIELVMPADAESVKLRQNGRVDHIALEVKDIDAVIDALKAKGIAFDADKAGTAPIFANGSKNIFLTGPDGERLELFEEL